MQIQHKLQIRMVVIRPIIHCRYGLANLTELFA